MVLLYDKNSFNTTLVKKISTIEIYISRKSAIINTAQRLSFDHSLKERAMRYETQTSNAKTGI